MKYRTDIAFWIVWILDCTGIIVVAFYSDNPARIVNATKICLMMQGVAILTTWLYFHIENEFEMAKTLLLEELQNLNPYERFGNSGLPAFFLIGEIEGGTRIGRQTIEEFLKKNRRNNGGTTHGN